MTDADPGDPRLDAVAVGPQKTATTWLDACLRSHPRLCLPEQMKETFFFDRHFDRGWSWYWAQFGDCPPGGVRAEVAPTLFHAPEAVRRLGAHHPECRIVVSLRHPAERAVSHWLHHRRKGRVGADFGAAIEAHPEVLAASRYAEHLPRWIEAFGRDRVHVVVMDDAADRPEDVLKGVYRFLGVEPPAEPPAAATTRVYGPSWPRFPALARAAAAAARLLRRLGMHGPLEAARVSGLRAAILGGGGQPPDASPELREELVRRLEEDVAYVEQLLGRELPGWRSA